MSVSRPNSSKEKKVKHKSRKSAHNRGTSRASPTKSQTDCYSLSPSPPYPDTSRSCHSKTSSRSPSISPRLKTSSPDQIQPSLERRQTLVESPSLLREVLYSPDTEYRLTQQRLREYHIRQEGLAEKNRQKVSDAIAVATKYLCKPYKLPHISVKDFLKACELEANERRLKTCHRASYFIKSPELCDNDIECVQCQVNRLRDGLNRVYPSKRFRCKHHCFSPTMDGGGERKSPQSSPVDICRKIELQRNCSPKTPPVPPAPPCSFAASQISHITPEIGIPTVTSAIGITPDLEYDRSKVKDLIDRYIPKAKLIHYQCRPRTRTYLYTDKTVGCNIVHNPYAIYRGKKVLTSNGKQKKEASTQQKSFKVPKLGVAYTLPDVNPHIGPRHIASPAMPAPTKQISKASTPAARQWRSRMQILPPIKRKETKNDG